jgi:hypothetical protein
MITALFVNFVACLQQQTPTNPPTPIPTAAFPQPVCQRATARSCVFKTTLFIGMKNFNWHGTWVKHDRSQVEVFHINVTCTSCCLPTNPYSVPAAPGSCLPRYEGVYLDGTFAGHSTFNVTSVGDLMSGVGTYANFADTSGHKFCPAPFALVLQDDTNVALVSYGATFKTKCGDYTGDSARYYRTSALN